MAGTLHGTSARPGHTPIFLLPCKTAAYSFRLSLPRVLGPRGTSLVARAEENTKDEGNNRYSTIKESTFIPQSEFGPRGRLHRPNLARGLPGAMCRLGCLRHKEEGESNFCCRKSAASAEKDAPRVQLNQGLLSTEFGASTGQLQQQRPFYVLNGYPAAAERSRLTENKFEKTKQKI